jgi:hypothetical protein
MHRTPRILEFDSKITIEADLKPNARVGDLIEIRLETHIPLDNAIQKDIFVLKPSLEAVIWPATQIEDWSQIRYTTKPEDLSVPGHYIMVARVECRDHIYIGERVVLDVRSAGEGGKITFKVNEAKLNKFDFQAAFWLPSDEIFAVYLYQGDQPAQELKEGENYKIEDQYITIISPGVEKDDRIEVIKR